MIWQSLKMISKNLKILLNAWNMKTCSLEDSFKAYEEGMRIVLSCNEQIDKVEKQLIILNEKNQENSYE